ncbi:MAG: helix-turn-helix transcriptional regulator [Oscillospiraceae bacterium]|nr:helix-turn-helix transcriptional regulator [Oscillospiraceae bacterium]
MTHAYSQLYLAKAATAVGNMLHDAVYEFGIDGGDFLGRFIQSGIAHEIESGNPKYIAGKSGLELCLEVIEKTSGMSPKVGLIESYDRSPEYWVGWMITHYQWYSGRSFRSILDAISYSELLGLYPILHEAAIEKSYEVLDMSFRTEGSNLKTIRKRAGLTQKELSEVSQVSINTIRAYEQGSKDISKAQSDIVTRLAGALGCDVEELGN